MVKTRFGREIRFAAVLAACLLLYGCFEYNEEIRFNSDGSGTVRAHGWIDYEVANRFYSGEDDQQVLPPITTGMVNYFAVGSRKVSIEEVSVMPAGGKWVFDITVAFANVEELRKTNYFRQRAVNLAFQTAKKLRFTGKATPSPLEIAKDHADVYKGNPYSAKFIEMYGTDEFKALAELGSLTYMVAIRGANAAGNADRVETTDQNTIEAYWSFNAGDLIDVEIPARFQLTTTLPPERGFTEVVVVLLVASIVGILAASIRLAMIKMKGAS